MMICYVLYCVWTVRVYPVVSIVSREAQSNLPLFTNHPDCVYL